MWGGTYYDILKTLLQYLIRTYLTFSSLILFCLYVLHTKKLCYVSLQFPALKLRQDCNLIVHKGAMFFYLMMPVNLTEYRRPIKVFNASIIMTKIKNKPISRRYYFCNTNQVSKNNYFFTVLPFSVSLFYFRQKAF